MIEIKYNYICSSHITFIIFILTLSLSLSLSHSLSLPSLFLSLSPSPPDTYRAILRLFVVFKLRSGILTTPSVPSPDRKKAQELVTNPQSPAPVAGKEEGKGEGEGDPGGKPLAWRATRTGKVIRSIHTGKDQRQVEIYECFESPKSIVDA
jgi:hypothetical protein